MKGCYLVRIQKEHQGHQEYIALVYSQCFDDFYWQIDELGFDPLSIEYKRVNIGGVSFMVTRTDEHKMSGGEFESIDYEFDQFSEFLDSDMDKDSKGWKTIDKERDAIFSSAYDHIESQ